VGAERGDDQNKERQQQQASDLSLSQLRLSSVMGHAGGSYLSSLML
jgi:hypothetical protein